MKKKKKATGAIGYVMLFTMAIIMVIITLFMLASSKLQTIQHDVDDALADSVLAALVADDIYYFETWEGTGTAVVRFRDLDESYRLYRDCMKDAIESKNDFYGNIRYPTFICYEVEDGEVTITTFNESGGRSEQSSTNAASISTACWHTPGRTTTTTSTASSSRTSSSPTRTCTWKP